MLIRMVRALYQPEIYAIPRFGLLTDMGSIVMIAASIMAVVIKLRGNIVLTGMFLLLLVEKLAQSFGITSGG
jgi:hypothetical protein